MITNVSLVVRWLTCRYKLQTQLHTQTLIRVYVCGMLLISCCRTSYLHLSAVAVAMALAVQRCANVATFSEYIIKMQFAAYLSS